MLEKKVRRVWNAARKKIKEECNKDEKKFALAEILALRELATQILDARMAMERQTLK